MSVTPSGTGPQPPDEPVTAFCAATYHADLRDHYAFIFRLPGTDGRFTVYAGSADRYEVGETYALTITVPDAVPLALYPEEWDFLRHCLRTVEQRWREAIAEADTGAQQPRAARVEQIGHLNAEPTPVGYRAASELFRDELDRVQVLGRLLDAAQAARRDGDPS